MDITTLAAAKKYTDDKLISSGNSGAVVDSTLTISGAAADAKVTGDKIKELNSKFDNFNTESVPGGPGGSDFIIIVDPTLTIEGAAADAKAVGDKFTSLELKMLTDDDIPEIAQQAAKLVDTALLSVLGDGVIE